MSTQPPSPALHGPAGTGIGDDVPADLRQPYLHDLTICVSAPALVVSGADGQLRSGGAQGFYCADVRMVSEAVVRVDLSDGPPLVIEPIGHAPQGAGATHFTAVLRGGDPDSVDPTLWLGRRRTVTGLHLRETFTISNVATQPRSVVLRLHLESDGAGMAAVKDGTAPTGPPLTIEPGRIGSSHGDNSFTVECDPPARPSRAGTGVDLSWAVQVPARGEAGVSVSIEVAQPGAVIVPPSAPRWPDIVVAGAVPDLVELVDRSLADLDGLRAATADTPHDTFLTAGAPWYLTLFGRDSLWAARMLLPVSVELAAGTLRTLAARQGTRIDPDTAEEPGKILHELRGTESGATALPPVYFGTIDATPLWICLLADARRWGLPDEQVRPLLPDLERALDWLARFGDSDGDGFLEYLDRSSRGLTNQGWKDSADSVRFADGRIAAGPVALAEVQGYAYQAALDGAELLEVFGRPGAERWRLYAADLRQRFREQFWCADDLGRYPALALDGAKQRVDAPASNMGHLLATGILDDDECRLVADRLLHPSMASGFGLRTMSATSGGYSPLSYHCGSVWPHDTAIAVHGLLRAGLTDQAARLAGQLLRAGRAFDGRLPELFAGFAVQEAPVPLPYPASCRPQAWSAAAAVVLLQTFTGLEVDVPAGWFRLRPAPVDGAFRVDGLVLGGDPLSLAIGADATVESCGYDGPLRLS